MISATWKPARPLAAPLAWLLLALLMLLPATAVGQQDVEDLFKDFGTVEVDASAQPEEGSGIVTGRVFDGETGQPVQGVTVIIVWPPSADGGPPPQEVEVTGTDGGYEFASIPAGTYKIQFVKSGYRSSTMTDFVVASGEVNEADFPLPPTAAATTGAVLELEEFVVEASQANELMVNLELRLDADELLNIMSAEELSKFAAGDVGEALKRVAGVNVVEGQFAIIRGLEDRYSSTLYNGAPVPSPDPDRQSVQLDLFPSDVVGSLNISKSFVGALPSNSSGGAIDIVTSDVPEERLQIKLSGGSGFNENAIDRFVEYVDDAFVGRDVDADDTIESDFGLTLGGRSDFFEREVRYKAVGQWEIDYETAEGFQEGREPDQAQVRLFPLPSQVVASGDLSLGRLSLSNGRFDFTESERSEQQSGFLGAGIDLDEAGNHKVDATVFFTKKREETAQLRENGFFPRADYGALAALDAGGQLIDRNDFEGVATLTSWLAGPREDRLDQVSRGPLYFTNFNESSQFLRKRDLLVYQLNGDHTFEDSVLGGFFDGLHMSWAANQARTTQNDESRGTRFFFEPEDVEQPAPTDAPVKAEALGPGLFAANSSILFSANDVEENQDFVRLDADYERDVLDFLTLTLTSGGWYERSKRSVDSEFLELPNIDLNRCGDDGSCTGSGSQFAILAKTPQKLGESIEGALLVDDDGDLVGLRDAESDAEREIWAWHGGLKATLWERLDLLGSVRIENIEITSENQAFVVNPAVDCNAVPQPSGCRFGFADTFPTRYLFFDRIDNPAIEGTEPEPGTTFNDELLGIDVPIDPQTGFVDLQSRDAVEQLVNGEIDKRRILPSAGFALRPLDGLSLRGAWSRTVARPSFREIAYYVSVEPGSDDRVIGNPQLRLSDVESFDGRVEYTWGDLGDLVAFSGFYKTIEDPIESIVIRDPTNTEGSNSALFRTFFNNPSEAELWGIEVEARKSFDFVAMALDRLDLETPDLGFLDYLSVGGNYTWIQAEVERTEAELARSESFFALAEGDEEEFGKLKTRRRLFSQPEWILNVDVTFDHPDWGTRLTLAYFAISDVLDAAGSAAINPNGEVRSFTLDRYVDSFGQLDFVFSQAFGIPYDPLEGTATFKFSAKNLTDSTRRIVYDPSQTRRKIEERSYKVGRDYSFSLSYSVSF